MSWRRWQARQRHAEIGDRFLAYVDRGSGPVALLLHGIPTWGFLWHRVSELLVDQGHRVLVPDLVGFGFSDKRDGFDRSIRAQAELLERWLAQLDLVPDVIVGHDIGGGVAQQLLMRCPRLVRRLVLVDSVAYDSWPIELMLQLGHPRAVALLPPHKLAVVLKRALSQGFAGRAEAPVLEGLLAPWRTDVGAVSLVRDAIALDTNLTLETGPALLRFEGPLLAVWGEADRFQPVSIGRRLAADALRGELVTIPNVGHFSPVEAPGEVAAAITRASELDALPARSAAS